MGSRPSDEPPNSHPERRSRGLLGGILHEFFRTGRTPEAPAVYESEPKPEPDAAPESHDYRPPSEQSAVVEPGRTPEPSRNLERVLAQFESMPEELADLKRSLGDVLKRFEEALDHLGAEARRLSSEASELASVSGRLQTRLGDLGRTMGQPQSPGAEVFREGSRYAAPEPPRPVLPEEPQFQPVEQGVTITLAGVPGFQGLMDAVRALNGLSATESASVVAFKNDEASIRVALRQPASAREFVEGLQSSTGQQALIEESRPDAQRLRLRFVERVDRR